MAANSRRAWNDLVLIIVGVESNGIPVEVAALRLWRNEISRFFSDKSGAVDSWDFVVTFFQTSKSFPAETLQNAGKVQNGDRLD